jgi:TonB-linked SusC/RagA family outer membrane protein
MGKSRWILAAPLYALLLALLPAHVVAQSTGTVQGTIVDAATQRPITGVQVTVRGTTLGTLTGTNGRFQIVNVPAGERTVRAEMIGYGASERAITVSAGGAATADFALSTEAVALEGVVVTALGIEREERSLTTSVQRVGGDQLTEARDPNLVAALSGKVAGVTITNSNTAGGSSRIVIRGVNSLTGNNQPLFVVDGIPVSNASSTSGSRGYNAIDYGNAIQDINPSDIESITVLKGPNAAALYGSRAANGAIIITTKSGRRAGGGQITANAGVTYESPLKLPEYQNLYGQGWNGQFAYVDGQGGGTNDDYDESWGPRLDGRLLPQFFSPIIGHQADGTPIREALPWVANPNNVRDFFETGRTANTSVAFSTSSDVANVRLSLSRMDQDGMIPGFRMERTNVALHGGSNLTDRLRTDASIQYINTGAVNRPSQGYGGANPMWAFLWFGRQVDTRLLKEKVRNEDGSQFNWNNIWNNNPYYLARENRNEDGRNRVIGNASLSYDLSAWLSATVRAGTDWFEENRRQQFAEGLYSMQVNVGDNGGFGVDNVFRQETNADFLLQSKLPRFGELGVEVDLGGARRDNRYRSNGIWVRELAVPGIYSYSNYVDSPTQYDYRERQGVNSLYGQARFAYRDYAFVDVSGRNDWSSTLPEGNNSYFYPAISGSLVFSELVPVPALSFGRLRAGWTKVGNDAPPYQTVDPYGFDVPFGGAPRLTASNILRNANLKPEQTASWEVGTDVRFLDDRLGLGATYYNKTTTNQIVQLAVSSMTGFTSRYINAGRISGRGFELSLDATPVRLANGLEWDVMANYSRDRSYVDELYDDMETIVLDRYYNVSVEARKGERYGAVYGRKYVRDSQGNIVIGSNGVPLNTASNPFDYLGNYNPDWVGSLSNTLRYRGVELSALIDMRQGGVIYSLTNNFGRRSGVLIESLQGRENTPFDSLVVPGVMVVGPDTVANTRRTSATTYHRGITGTNPIAEEFVYDASFIKLRELRLGYDVPRSLTSRWGVSGMRVALVGRNLWLKSDVPHIDPETAFNAGNAQGYEYGQMPSAKSFGFNISVTP